MAVKLWLLCVGVKRLLFIEIVYVEFVEFVRVGIVSLVRKRISNIFNYWFMVIFLIYGIYEGVVVDFSWYLFDFYDGVY